MRPIGLLAAAVMSGLSSAALAAEESKGMPQLDFGNVLTKSQVVWLALIFFVLYLLLSKWALPKVGTVLEKRASTIAGELQAAQTAKTAADAAVAELTAKTRAAQSGAQAEIAGAAEAEQRIAAARAAAMGALRQVAGETAAVVVTRLTGVHASQPSVDAAVGAALAARGLA